MQQEERREAMRRAPNSLECMHSESTQTLGSLRPYAPLIRFVDAARAHPSPPPRHSLLSSAYKGARVGSRNPPPPPGASAERDEHVHAGPWW